MNALTLHAMDESLVLALRKYAAEFGTSLNYASGERQLARCPAQVRRKGRVDGRTERDGHHL